MPSFRKYNNLYSVSIITGPGSVLLRLELLDERIEDFEVVALAADGLYRRPTKEVVRSRVLEGTDEANQEFGTQFHPWLAQYAVEDFNDDCYLLRRAAYAIVKRLAEYAEAGYEASV